MCVLTCPFCAYTNNLTIHVIYVALVHPHLTVPENGMDPVHLQHLLLHQATTRISPTLLHDHGFLETMSCLKRSNITGEYALSLAAEGHVYRNSYDAFTGTVMYGKSNNAKTNTDITNTLVGTVVDLFILTRSGDAFRVPVIVCDLKNNSFPLTIMAHINKGPFQPVQPPL